MARKPLPYQQLIWEPKKNRVFISSGFGCPVGCIYCYIYEDGYSLAEPILGKLSSKALKDSLLSNKRFRVGKSGTIVAFGCVSDPFHPVLEARTLEYIETLSDMENPIQFAAKFSPSEEGLKVILSVPNPVYPMISISSLEHYKLLEPGAPLPETRLSTIKHLSEIGLKTTLFYKPVIPGINDHEYRSMINAALENGAEYFVAGIAYMNDNLIEKLGQNRFDVRELRGKGVDMLQPVWMRKKISPVMSHDLLDSIVREARNSGLKAFKDSVCVIADDLGIQCPVQASNPRFCSGHNRATVG